nr:hypothetical protein [uncultured Tyzzerella sp.]
MTNERMMILEMVKDGKITVDDGVKLLNAINKSSSSNFDDFANDIKYKINNIPKPNSQKIKQNTQAFFNKTEEIFDDFTKSVKDFFNTNNTQQQDNNQTININPVDQQDIVDNNQNNDENINKN